MANIQTKFGFRYKRSMNPSTVPLVVECPVTVNTYIYPGDLVEYGTPPFVSTMTNAIHVPYGVAIGYGSGYAASDGIHYEENVLVIPLADNPNYVFEARVGSTTNIGLNDLGSFLSADLAAGNSVLRQSRHGLDGATLDASGGAVDAGTYWRIVGFPTDPQNEVDAGYVRVLVTCNAPLAGTLAVAIAAS